MGNNICAPCPKCGSENGHAVFGRRHLSSIVINVAYTDYGVRCDDCGYEVSGCMTEHQAIRKWNLESKKRRVKDESFISDSDIIANGDRGSKIKHTI